MGSGRHGAHVVLMQHGCLCRTGCMGCSETCRCPSDLSVMDMASCNPPKPPHHVWPTTGAPSSTIIHTCHLHQHSRLMIKGDQNSRTENQNAFSEKDGKEALGRCTALPEWPPEIVQCKACMMAGALGNPEGPLALATVTT